MEFQAPCPQEVWGLAWASVVLTSHTGDSAVSDALISIRGLQRET